VSASTAVIWVKRFRETGRCAAKPRGGSASPLEKHADFLLALTEVDAPTLKPNEIVMIDNLPARKAAGVREAIEARGATLRYLPKYSPDLNPIEISFSKLKAYLRKAGARTIPRLRRRIGSFARSLTAREVANYFKHAGYA
jgi:transposase